MSFRTRLLLFFTIIVIVPMGAVALVLFSITSQTDLGVRVYNGPQRLASTVPGDRGAAPPASGKVKIGDADYRGKFEQLDQQLGPKLSIGVFTPAGGISDSIGRSRVLIGIILLGFLGVA